MTEPCPDDLAAFKHEPADYERPVGRDSPSAFPVNAANLGAAGAYPAEPGMALRDWFAGQALAGLLSDRPSISFTGDQARTAYRYADAMLAARGETSHG